MMKPIRFLLVGLTALILLLAANRQVIKAGFPTFIPSSSLVPWDMADGLDRDEQNEQNHLPRNEEKVARTLPEETLTANERDEANDTRTKAGSAASKGSASFASDSSAWSVSEATAKQIERAVAFRLVLEGQGEVTIDLQLMRSGGVIITEQIQQRFDGNGPHTVTHDIRIPHRLGDLSLKWQLIDKEGTPLTSIESIAVK